MNAQNAARAAIEDTDADAVTQDVAQRSASGTVLSAAGWLDDHFEACRDEYTEMLRAAGLRSGWHVLDVGCGTGSYLPLIRDEVGASGRVLATDRDPENVAIARQQHPLSEPLVGSALALPVRTAGVDAVWCANVTQYFSDEDLPLLLGELARVVRPGGLVAVKDVDMSALRIAPGGPFLGAHLAEACVTSTPVAVESGGSLRGRELGLWLERAGLEGVRQQTFAIEYRAPLSAPAARLWASWLPYLARLAEEKGVPDVDLATWRRVSTPERAAAFVAAPEFYACELQVLAIGRMPESAP
ncbi:MAG: class I SAM-dependent methyltransferase [Dehalococcoidia bacterium]